MSRTVAAVAVLAGWLACSAAFSAATYAARLTGALSQSSSDNTAYQSSARSSATAAKVAAVLSADSITGRPVIDQQGHDAGKVSAITLDTATGAVDFIVIAGDETFNLGGNLIAVPWHAVVPPTTASGPIRVTIAAAKLAKAPRFLPNTLYELGQTGRRANIYGYYGYSDPQQHGPACPSRRAYDCPNGTVGAAVPTPRPYTAPPGAAPWSANSPNATAAERAGGGPGKSNGLARTERSTQGPLQSTKGNEARHGSANPLVEKGLVIGVNGIVSAMHSPTTVASGAVRAASVHARNGDSLGDITHVLIDTQYGHVAFVLLQRGGFLGLKPAWFAVPIEALAWEPHSGGYRLTADESLLRTERPVTAAKMPTRIPVADLAQLYHHFNLTPYWQRSDAKG